MCEKQSLCLHCPKCVSVVPFNVTSVSVCPIPKTNCRTQERNPLDLNNLPDDCSRDGQQASDQDIHSSGLYRKKKSGGKGRKKAPNKVYECRFCSLKFCKSQALGGHMNRHRQERETETLNKARLLVFTNDLVNPGHSGLLPNPGSVFPPRLFPTSTTPQIPPPPPPSPLPLPLPMKNYFLEHAIPNSSQGAIIPPERNSYACIGPPEIETSGGGAEESRSRRNEEEVRVNWGTRR